MSAGSEPLTSGPPAAKNRAGLVRAGGLLAVAVGFGLRVYLLDRQGLWYDEAFNLSVARAGWPELLSRAAADFYPPLYHLILWAWTGLVGTGEFAVRYPSVWFGTLLVPAVFSFGRVVRQLSPADRAGRIWPLPVLGALLAAFSPLVVDLSQEARMYTLLGLAMALGEVSWLRLGLKGGGVRDGVIYVAATAAGLYTHYAALLGWVLQPWQVRFAEHDRRLRLLLWWAAPVLLFGPWWGVAWGRFSGTVNPGAGTSLPEILRRSVEIFWTGYGVEPFFPAPDPATAAGDTLKATALGLAVTAIFLYGLLSGRETGRRYLIPLAGPLILWYPVALGRRDFAPQYVIWVAVLGWVFVALGILRLPRLPAAGALGLTLGAEVFALFNLHYVPRYWNDDFRGVARLIEGLSRPGEAIIVNAHYATVALDYYYRGQAPRFGLPTRPDQPDPSLEAELQRVARAHPFVWLVLWQTYYSDPRDRVNRWFATNGYLAEDWELRPHARVMGFWMAPPVLDALPPEAVAGPAAALGDSIRLAGLVPPRPVLEPVELASGRPELHYILYWEVVRPVDEAYNVFVHVLDPAGRVVLQGDGPPVRGSFPTDRWPAGKIIRDDRMLRLPPDFRSGEYRLLIGMYRLSDLVRLGHGGVDRVEVGPFKIGP